MLVADMNGVAGTYSVLNTTFNTGNRTLLQVGSGSAVQFYEFIFPAPGSSVYVQISSVSGVAISRSSDGASITTTFTGTPYPRGIACT